MTTMHRNRKSDRLHVHGATTAEIAAAYACLPFDRAARAMEEKWGVERLPALVAPELAARFGKAMARLNAAIDKADADEVAGAVGICTRGLAAMDAAAVAAGHAPMPPEVWQCEVDGKPAAILRDFDQWPSVQKALPGVRLYSLREVTNALAAYGNSVGAVKDIFAGAEAVAVKPAPFKRSAIAEDLEDEIPY